MPLNTAQYVAPLNSAGVLTGLVQGVKQGPVISILPDGTITLDPTTSTGFVVTNNPTAAQYVWPTLGAGEPGQQLADDGSGNLYWTSDFVRVYPAGGTFLQTGAAAIPAGPTGSRPLTASPGFLRYNSSTTLMEYWDGAQWVSLIDENEAATTAEAIAGVINFKYSSPATAIAKSSPGTTGAAVLPAGTTFQRPTLASGLSPGWIRFNFEFQLLEYYDGAGWKLINPYFQPMDNISSLFDGIETTFELKVAGVPHFPIPPDNLLVFLGGVQQIFGSGQAWNIVFGKYIVFDTPPQTGTTCDIFRVALTPG
jgi:hypothetical protein